VTVAAVMSAGLGGASSCCPRAELRWDPSTQQLACVAYGPRFVAFLAASPSSLSRGFLPRLCCGGCVFGGGVWCTPPRRGFPRPEEGGVRPGVFGAPRKRGPRLRGTGEGKTPRLPAAGGGGGGLPPSARVFGKVAPNPAIGRSHPPRSSCVRTWLTLLGEWGISMLASWGGWRVERLVLRGKSFGQSAGWGSGFSLPPVNQQPGSRVG
jgi:hypothetical protein